MSAVSDIYQGDVSKMSQEKEPFQINGQEKPIPGDDLELTPKWQEPASHGRYQGAD